jgi:putative SOS response-associated peptidase YedK
MADKDATPFAFAGIWDSWKRPDGTRIEDVRIVPTEPNQLVSQIHEELALIPHPRDYDGWLGIDGESDSRPLLGLLRPYDPPIARAVRRSHDAVWVPAFRQDE